MNSSLPDVTEFRNIDKENIDEVGELGIQTAELIRAGCTINDGFVITNHAYFEIIKKNNFHIKIPHLLARIDPSQPESILFASIAIKKLFLQADVSDELVKHIFTRYESFNTILKDSLFSISCSITPNTYSLNPSLSQAYSWGEANLLLKIKEGWAAVFSPELIAYRIMKNIPHFKNGIAIHIQKTMDASSFGILFTSIPSRNKSKKIIIKARLGVNSQKSFENMLFDEYTVSSDFLITDKKITLQKEMFKINGTKISKVNIPNKSVKVQKLTDVEILDISKQAKKIMKHFYFPQECHWIINNKKLYINSIKPHIYEPIDNSTRSTNNLFASGIPLFPGLSTGTARIIQNSSDFKKINIGDVLIISNYFPELINFIGRSVAVIFNDNITKSNIQKLIHEKSMPMVSFVKNTLTGINNGQIITVNGTKGQVYKGGFIQPKTYFSELNRNQNVTATKISLDLTRADAEHISNLENFNGIALLSGNYFINALGTHPKSNKYNTESYINNLAVKINKTLEKISPLPAIYTISDLTTTNYRALKNGKMYDSIELNPALGFKGAFRHIHDTHSLHAELRAIRQIRHKSLFKNLWISVPFIRTVKELVEIKKSISAEGLHRSSSLQLWINLSVPSNIILLEKYIETGIDGIMIDLDSLIMLTLGIDKENTEFQNVFHKIDEAVLLSIKQILLVAKKHNTTTSLFGSNLLINDELIEILVRWGITSICIQPGINDGIKQMIQKTEKKLLNRE